MSRRLHLTLRIDDRHRVTATFRRLWGAYDAGHPVIRLQLDQPPGVRWSWVMRLLATSAHEVDVSDEWEAMSSTERYGVLRDAVLRLYEGRAGQPDRYVDGRRKQSRKT